MSSVVSENEIDRFALYLAAGLLGPSKVIEYLNNSKPSERPEIPLYWRSKLMIPDPSRLYHVGENVDSKIFPFTKILFFDATFHFVKKVENPGGKDSKSDLLTNQEPSSCRVLVSLGFFVLLQKRSEVASNDPTDAEVGGGQYISTQAIDYQQIMSHITSLQLDPLSVTPEALASSMAEEFLLQGSPSRMTAPKVMTARVQQQFRGDNELQPDNYDFVKRHDTNAQKDEIENVNQTFARKSQSFINSSIMYEMCVNIPYQSMGDSPGRLQQKFSPDGVMEFGKSELRFLFWDFSKNPNHFENLSNQNESVLSKKDHIENAFERWKARNENDGNNVESLGQQTMESSNNSTDVKSAIDVNKNRTNHKQKKRRNLKGMGILPSARRKRNKGLVYDAK